MTSVSSTVFANGAKSVFFLFLISQHPSSSSGTAPVTLCVNVTTDRRRREQSEVFHRHMQLTEAQLVPLPRYSLLNLPVNHFHEQQRRAHLLVTAGSSDAFAPFLHLILHTRRVLPEGCREVK